MKQKLSIWWQSFTQSMDKLPRDLRNFLYGGLGYAAGAIIGLIFLLILNWLKLAYWIIGLIPEGQNLLVVLAIPLLAGTFLGLAGAISGAIGGWSLGQILGLKRKQPVIVDSAVTFAASQGLLILIFLILISIIATYNNFNINSIERYGIIFGLFGLVFGLFSGIILAFMSLRLRHTWRVFLGTTLGFTIAGAVTGALLRLFSPTGGFSQLAGAVAIIGSYLSFYFLGGGILGWTHGRLAKNLKVKEQAPESALPPRWQEISTAVIGILIVFSLLSFLGQISRFLVIDPANLPSQLVYETQGVRYSADQALAFALSGDLTQLFDQPSVAVDNQNTQHLVWRGGSADEPVILYSRCQSGVCSTPQVISNAGNLSCLVDAKAAPSQPAIAVDQNGSALTAWQAGGSTLVYSAWDDGNSPPLNPIGCVPGVQGDVQGNLGLAKTAADSFTLAFGSNESNGTIFITHFNGSVWRATPQPVSAGNNPALSADSRDEYHLAYCTSDGSLRYQSPNGQAEPVEGECIQPPALAIGADDQPHLVRYADQVLDVNGLPRPASAIMESVRKGEAWTTPAIAASPSKPTEPALAEDAANTLHLVWSDISPQGENLFIAEQPVYQCDPSTLPPIEQAGLAAIQAGNFFPAGQQVPYCGNRCNGIWYAPNPEPAFSNDIPTENGVFDRVAKLVDLVQYEVLFTTMQYEPESASPNPGATMAQALVQLYQKVKEHPENYPRGMNVRILLGNYPTLSTFEWGDQIWAVMEDLRKAGLEKLVDEEIGWRVEIANYAGTYPHAHTKFMVVDGATVVGVGFNYGYLHFPKDHPSGKGYDLFDLALGVSGPAAQDALTAFDSMWQGANEVTCNTLVGDNWKNSCQEKTAKVSHSPEVLQTYLPAGGQDTSFSLLRTVEFKEADAFIETTLKSATQTIDMMQVNFSLEVYCMADLIFPGICSFDNALPYMTAMMEAIERNHVHVRVIMENSNSNGLENRVAGQVFMEELKRRELDQYVELRFYHGKVHAKSTLVDGELLMIGSMNMHYSSWSANALAEYVVTSDNPQAIQEYQRMFETKWADAIPFEEAEFNTTP